MNQFLIFTVYAPLVSWGEIAVGEARGSWDRPSRSALLGLVAAALGLTREDQDGHDALDQYYGVAVRLDAPGRAMEDFHTAQTVAESAIRKDRPATRAALLAAGDHETMLSRRVYRTDALATVSLWANAGARWSLSHIAYSLHRPTFVLYAGRKANPLGLPLDPEIVTANTLAEALAKRKPPGGRGLEDYDRLRPRGGWGREVAHDPVNGFASGLIAQRRETRRDAEANRTRWQFNERTVEVGLMPDIVP